MLRRRSKSNSRPFSRHRKYSRRRPSLVVPPSLKLRVGGPFAAVSLLEGVGFLVLIACFPHLHSTPFLVRVHDLHRVLRHVVLRDYTPPPASLLEGVWGFIAACSREVGLAKGDHEGSALRREGHTSPRVIESDSSQMQRMTGVLGLWFTRM